MYNVKKGIYDIIWSIFTGCLCIVETILYHGSSPAIGIRMCMQRGTVGIIMFFPWPEAEAA